MKKIKEVVSLVVDSKYSEMFWVECNDGWRSSDYTNFTRASDLKATLLDRYAVTGGFDPYQKYLEWLEDARGCV